MKRIGPLAPLAAAAGAGGLSLWIQGASVYAFLVPFLVVGTLAGGVLVLLALLRQRATLENAGLVARDAGEDELEASYTAFELGALDLLTVMGFQLEEARATPDRALQIVATNRRALLGGRYVIRAKETSEPIAALYVAELYAEVVSRKANKGLFLTNATFTSNAQTVAESRPLELIDGEKLDDLLREHAAPSLPKGAPPPEPPSARGDTR